MLRMTPIELPKGCAGNIAMDAPMSRQSRLEPAI